MGFLIFSNAANHIKTRKKSYQLHQIISKNCINNEPRRKSDQDLIKVTSALRNPAKQDLIKNDEKDEMKIMDEINRNTGTTNGKVIHLLHKCGAFFS